MQKLRFVVFWYLPTFKAGAFKIGAFTIKGKGRN